MTLRRKLLAAAFVAVLAVPGVAKAEDNFHLTYHAAFGIAALNEASRVWMDEIEARTDGRVTFTRLFGGALGKFAGQPDGLRRVRSTSGSSRPCTIPVSTRARRRQS